MAKSCTLVLLLVLGSFTAGCEIDLTTSGPFSDGGQYQSDSQVPFVDSDGGVPMPEPAPTVDAGPTRPPTMPSPPTGPAVPYDCAGTSEAEITDLVSPPGTMEAGATARIELLVANCGPATWMSAPATDSAAGVKLGNDRNGAIWNPTRVVLGSDVPPNHSITVSATITAPGTGGEYPYQWRVVDEWVRWIESPSTLRSVRVNGPPARFDVHQRTAWVGSQPVTGPSMDLRALRYITIHYPGGNVDTDGSDGVYQDSDMANHLRSDHAGYLRNRGYSYGYNSVMAPDGDEWLVRGNDIRAASNGCTAVNVPGYTIQVLLPSITASPTAEQVAGVQQAVARVRAMAMAAGNPNHLPLNGHRDVRPMCGSGGTSCPGEALYSLISSGALEP